MSSDGNLVSKEDHEMNYILQKWNKKQSKDNRELLVKALEDFKKDEKYKPHNRESFYKYCEDKKIVKKLEDV